VPAEAVNVQRVDVRAVGLAIIDLGGGRRREDDAIDHAVGLTEIAAPGERVGPGERPLAVVHARDEAAAARAADALRAAFTIGEAAPATGPAVLERLAEGVA
jgi:thymidine phosphorylase